MSLERQETVSAFLEDILEAKRKEVRRLRVMGRVRRPAPRPSRVRDFYGAIAGGEGASLIAEIKFASPSAGAIRTPEDPASLAVQLAKAGAAALSVVTEQTFFYGDPSSLSAVSLAVSIPLLCKDFFLDEIQVEEAWGRGADAVLLIARILPPGRLSALLACCRFLGLEALVEVCSKAELDRALTAGARIVGVNNRDLSSFKVDLGRFAALAAAVPEGIALVSESGVKGPGDVRILREQGADAVLAGTVLMESPDPASEAARLVSAGRAV